MFAVVFFMGQFGLDPQESTLGGMILALIRAVFVAAGAYVVAKARRNTNLLSEGIDCGRGKR